jgi:pimeloyl-ACP methyl ester carboxylesterase
MYATTREVAVIRDGYRLHADATGGPGTPLILMHGFPDSTHLYDRLLPHLAGRRAAVRFDFLGWGRSDKPARHSYTVDGQVRDLDAVVAELGAPKVTLVAHDASGPPAIDWALRHPDRIEHLVLLNTYYHWMPALRRPPAIALYSTPVLKTAARAAVGRWPDLNKRLYAWQVGGFIQDPGVRRELVPLLYEQFAAARPAFWSLNDELLRVVISRRKRRKEMRAFTPPVKIIFGARDRYLNPRVARDFADLFPASELHLLLGAGHYVQVDEPERVAQLILA